MEEKTTTRGGKREGSGRKKTIEKKITIGISKEALEALEGVNNKSDFICKAIIEYAKHNK